MQTFTPLLINKSSMEVPQSFDDSWIFGTPVIRLPEQSPGTPHRSIAAVADHSFSDLLVWLEVHPTWDVACIWPGLVPAHKVVSKVCEKGMIIDESSDVFAKGWMLGDLLELIKALLAVGDKDSGQDVASTAGSKLLGCQAHRFEILWSEVATDHLRELWWELLHGKRRINDGRT